MHVYSHPHVAPRRDRSATPRPRGAPRGTRKLLLCKLAEPEGSSETDSLAFLQIRPSQALHPAAPLPEASFTQRRMGAGRTLSKVCVESNGATRKHGRKSPGARATHRVTVRLGSVSGGRTCASSRLLHTTLPSVAPTTRPAARGRPSCLQPGGSASAPRPPPSSASSASRSSIGGGGGRPLRRPGGSMLRAGACGWNAGLAGQPGARVGGDAARALRCPEPHGGGRTRPPRRRHVPLSAAAALGLWGAAG